MFFVSNIDVNYQDQRLDFNELDKLVHIDVEVYYGLRKCLHHVLKC